MKYIAFTFGACLVFHLFSFTIAHSWLSCPQSFDPNPERGYYDEGPCETVRSGKRPVTPLRAGERLKVGWPSNNHGGGYVRLALVPESQIDNEEAYKSHVLKFTCYGHDERPDKFRYGDCHHPCNGRPGCEYQSSRNDSERYDTTITIPTNLKDGRYVLQWVALSASETRVYYSCSLLSITGGNPGLRCNRSGLANVARCMPNDGDPLETISHGTKAGNFCFEKEGLGDIDDRIWERPVNADCDPRTGCVVTSDSDYCERTIQGIRNPRNPKQLSCKHVVEVPPNMNITTNGNRQRKWIRTEPKPRQPKLFRPMPKRGNRRQRFNSKIKYHRPSNWNVEKGAQRKPSKPSYLVVKSNYFPAPNRNLENLPKLRPSVQHRLQRKYPGNPHKVYWKNTVPKAKRRKYIPHLVDFLGSAVGMAESKVGQNWHQYHRGSTDYTYRRKGDIIGSDCEEDMEEEEEDPEYSDGESEEHDSDDCESDGYSDEEYDYDYDYE